MLFTGCYKNDTSRKAALAVKQNRCVKPDIVGRDFVKCKMLDVRCEM
jgi:hypothetical protein